MRPQVCMQRQKSTKVGKFSVYKVDLASKSDGHYEQDFKIGKEFFENMENSDVQAADVHVHMDMEKKNDTYDCTFHCTGTLQVPCDRCLDPMDLDVDTTYHVVVKYGDDYDDGDNLLIIPYSNTYLNVSYMLYDTLLLTIPLRHVHAPGKCNRAMLETLRRHRGARDDDEESMEAEEAREEAAADIASEDNEE